MIMCPQCKKMMEEVSGFSHYGTLMKIDQCPQCRGMWFDRNELWQLSYKSAMKIDRNTHDTEKNERYLEFSLNPAKRINTEDRILACPHCHSPLVIYSADNFTPDIEVDYCTSCNGFWLDAGELSRFKEAMKKRKEMHDKENSALHAQKHTNSSSYQGRSSLSRPMMYYDYRREAYRSEANALLLLCTSLFKGAQTLIKRSAKKFTSPSKNLPPTPHTSQIHMKKEILTPGKGEVKSERLASKVSLNTSSLSMLSSLPMLNLQLAQRIIEYRTKNGPFQKKSDLLRVRGMTPQIFSRVKESITIDQDLIHPKPESEKYPRDGEKIEKDNEYIDRKLEL
ncbi:MAG: zf-TFIIB domain-containing protein [bacterium]